MAQKTPILNLTHLTETNLVTIDGTAYPLKSRILRNVLETAKLAESAEKISEFGPRFLEGQISMDLAQELASLLDETCRFVLDAPPEVHAKLDDFQRMDICKVFMTLLPASLPTNGAMLTATQAHQPGRPIGARSSRASSASTAAARGTGSRKSRSASSVRA